MAAIKRFFEKRKLDAKFKLAGEGHKLTTDTRSNSLTSAGATSSAIPKSSPAEITAEKQMAAEAALARMTKTKDVSNVGVLSLKTQMKSDLLAEKKSLEAAKADAARYSSGPKEVTLEASPVVERVCFRCPIAGPQVLPMEEMEAHIEAFLLGELEGEPAMVSALMIHTLNKNAAQIKQCIETLGKYIDNIINHPNEDKYMQIRASNKVLVERILSLRGAREFLQAAGFEWKKIAIDGAEEEYLVFDFARCGDSDRLNGLKEILNDAEPIRMELDRGTRVFYPSKSDSKIQVPDEFYNVTAEELKREQQIREEAIREMGMLRTKQMRERDRQRELRRYRYAIIRIRFPDGYLLQGTFHARDKFSAVREFVSSCLKQDWIPFSLATHLGQKLTDDDSTLAELDLAPASLLQFAYDQSILESIVLQQGSVSFDAYLNGELMATVASL